MPERVIRYRNGAYEIVVYAGPDPVTKKPRRVSRTVRMPQAKRLPKDVKDLEARLVNEVGTGEHSRGKLTVGQLLNLWIVHVRSDLSPTTVYGYERCIRLYLKPSLENVRLDKLTTAHLDRLYRRLTDGNTSSPGLSPATVRQAHAVMRRALVAAQRWGYVDRNVAAIAEPPSVKRAPVEPPSAAEIDRLIAGADPDLRFLIRLALGTGARRAELCGLRWSDLRDNEIVITRSVTTVGHNLVHKDTKSGRGRRVPVGPKLLATLTERHDAYVARCELLGAKPSPEAYILSESDTGLEPLHPSLVSDRFRRLSRAEGLKVRFHDLRHAAASQALAGGAQIRDVAAFLGHAQTSTTLNIYAHTSPAGLGGIAVTLDR